MYVKRGTHPEPAGTTRNHPEPTRNHPEPPGTYPESPGTLTENQNNKNHIKVMIKKQNENKTKKHEIKMSSFNLAENKH